MKLVLVIVALTAVFTAKCRDFPDGFKNQAPQVDDDSTDETQHLPIAIENQNTDEEVKQLNEIGDMSMLLGRSKWCRSRDGRCLRRKFSCGYGYQASPFGRPYCTSRMRRCCYPVTSAISTTTAAPATTTSGPTSSPSLKWLTVGADRFVKYNNTMNWTDARAVCRNDGLDLYEPKDILAVSKYLDENYFNGSSSVYFWLGGSANGTHQIWFSGSVVPSDAPWYSNYATWVDTNHCMLIIAYGGFADKGTVLISYNCDTISSMRPLCG